MESARPQSADDVFNLILLEQANAGDAGGSSVQARYGVSQLDATKSEDWDLCRAGFPQGGKACGGRSGGASFSEYRSEDGKVRIFRFGAEDIGGCVAGGSHYKMVSGQLPVDRKLQHLAHFGRRDIVGPEMNAISSYSQRNVGAGID
jgi:hypothetical protein